jgi:O-antigen ligase
MPAARRLVTPVAPPSARRGWFVAAYLAVLMVLGGGGSPAPLAELACELIAVLALIAWLAMFPRQSKAADRTTFWIIALIALPPLLQLIPLPPVIWQALPGREPLAEGLAAIGAGDRWLPWSIAPWQTLAALLSLGPPLLALWMVAQLSQAELRPVIRTIAGIALLAIAVGAVQLAEPAGGPLDFYDTGQVGMLLGFQANHNTAADVLLVGLLALALSWRELHRNRRDHLRLAATALALVLLLGVFLTASRAGIGLSVSIAGIAWLLVRNMRERQTRKRFRRPLRTWTVVAGLGAIAAASFWLRGNPVVRRVLARFDPGSEFRPELWHDSWQAVLGYWPVGSGLGTFMPGFLPFERLEVVDATLPNRAHNELLELAIEGGLPLVLCWLAATGLVLARLWSGLRGKADFPVRWFQFSGGVLLLAALHSLVDYPLRSVAMATLVAVAAGIVLAGCNFRSDSQSIMQVNQP